MSLLGARPILLIGFALAALADTRAFAQSPKATPSPSPTPSPAPIREIVEQEAEKIVQKEMREGVPRFEDRVDVLGKTPQMMLERFFGGAEVECGALPGGVPSESDMRDARPMPAQAIDLMGAAQALLKALKGEDKGPPKYFLYRVRKANDARYELREGKIPVAWMYGGINGSTFELLQGFSDRDTAVRGLRRMEKGFLTPTPLASERESPWVYKTCRTVKR